MSARLATLVEPARTDSAFVDEYLAHLLARASQIVSTEFHHTLHERGVPVMHWRVLASLIDGSQPVTALAQIAIVKLPTMSKLIARMQAEGLVRRQVDGSDRRRVLVSLTPRGMRMAEPLVELARQHERSVLEPFGARDSRTLIEVLKRLIALHAPVDGVRS
jgi:DNA-binding MarR family transcriptional regulator